jgi:hypothetical protein
VADGMRQMSQPSVTAVMLVNGRRKMACRAIRCFRAQTCPKHFRELLVWDTGEDDLRDEIADLTVDGAARHFWLSESDKKIGTLRNDANGACRSDIICHWDSDDWSHPQRIEEQVNLLIASGADAVGYRDSLFWDTAYRGSNVTVSTDVNRRYVPGPANEAWFYQAQPLDRTQVVGSSLMYWRRTWERWSFLPDTSQGEEMRLANECNGNWVSSISTMRDAEPRMICAIHGENTSHYGIEHRRGAQEWTRCPGWDKFCAERMRL